MAQTAIASAEEAYRVTDPLVRAGGATTTDLLDSQSALTQSRLNLIRAKQSRPSLMSPPCAPWAEK